MEISAIDQSVTSAVQPDSPILEQALTRLETTVQQYFPRLWPGVDLSLATCATLLLKDNVNPVAVIFVGPPSAGKSTVLEMFGDAKVNGEVFCYVSDSFTPASFVSQAANVETDQLDQVDLLPRIKHKVLVTPELAPIFRGREDELIKTFSTLTRVLDGQGFTRDSGTHGQRGYRGDYLFSWLGGTTPFDKKVWKVMSQLGSRLFFLVMDHTEEITLEELIQPTAVPYATKLAECRAVVHQFLPTLFEAYEGVRGVAWDQKADDSTIKKWIGQCAMLLAKMRSEPARVVESTFKEDEYTQGSSEAPYRAYAVLYNLARGHALVNGRTYLTWEDLPFLAQVTVSTIPPPYGRIFEALVGQEDGQLSRAEVQAVMKVASPSTAKSSMEDMEKMGVVQYVSEGQGVESYLEFNAKWAWCRSEEFQSLLTPNLSKIGGCV